MTGRRQSMKGRLTMKRLRPLHPTHEDPMSVETWGGGAGISERNKRKKERRGMSHLGKTPLHTPCHPLPVASQERLKDSSAAMPLSGLRRGDRLG